MSDLFEDKNISPMLLYETQPFDDENYIYELKLDGIRCLAYIDGSWPPWQMCLWNLPWG